MKKNFAKDFVMPMSSTCMRMCIICRANSSVCSPFGV